MISLIIALVVLGLIAYCVTLLPIPAPFNQIINIILVLVAIGYLLSAIGVNVPLIH